MAKIYLINVGANTQHARRARSPIFSDDSWIYVSFPRKKKSERGQRYPREALSFVKVRPGIKTHLDPDWKGLTYGDCCENPRAQALKKVETDDMLLFWALLWRVKPDAAEVFKSDDKGWYLIGALRVKRILETGNRVGGRARNNAHVRNGRVEQRNGVRVFVGHKHHSCRFKKAVDLEVGKNNGLMQQIVKTTDGRKIQWNRKPHWNSVTRSCRAILDTSKPEDKKLIQELERRITKRNGKIALF